MTNKEEYLDFVNKIDVPVFSMPWWMDAVCGEDNWDVWICKQGGKTVAALPYYMENRNDYLYITKASLTQNNGLLIDYPSNQSFIKKTKMEEKIIDELVVFLKSKNIDVYEQQYHHSFENFLPFFWHGFDIIPRITYVLKSEIGIDNIDAGFSSNYRNKIKKGEKSIKSFSGIDMEKFYYEHEKIFKRQGLECPFSFELWKRLYYASQVNNAGEIIASIGDKNEILSLAFLVSDKTTTYLLLGGEVPEYSALQTFPRLVKECIKKSFLNNKNFDFEGSVIKRINHSFREYGGKPMEYYRIRKVFNADIIRYEAGEKIKRLSM